MASPLASRLSLVPRHFAMRASSVTRALRRDAETDGDRAFDVRATALASASSSDGGDYLVLVGYEDGSLARFDVRVVVVIADADVDRPWIAFDRRRSRGRRHARRGRDARVDEDGTRRARCRERPPGGGRGEPGDGFGGEDVEVADDVAVRGAERGRRVRGRG